MAPRFGGMQLREDPDAAIERIAAAQHGVVTRRQIVESGVSARSIDRRLARCRLHLLYRGVYRVGPIETPRAREMAALLACGPASALSHRSARALWDGQEAPQMIEVTVPRTKLRRVRGIAVHRSSTLTTDSVVMQGSLRVTTPLRTVIDLAAVLPRSELEQAIARLERCGHLESTDLLSWAEANRRAAGAAPLRALLAEGNAPAFTRSEAEQRLLELIRRGRLRTPQVNVRLHGYEVDFLWSGEKLVVEVDGFAYHASARAFANDRRRDAILTANGFRVIRLTWNDIAKQPEATLVMVAQALARG